MTLKSLSKNYDCLTPEERFRLILAASGRGDEVEGERLTRAGKRITMSVQDHAPFARAFAELDSFTFIEAVEDASRYYDAYGRVIAALGPSVDEIARRAAQCGEAKDKTAAPEGRGDAGVCKDPSSAPRWKRYVDQARALGYVMLSKVDGWQQFCEEMTVPPFFTWKVFPGYDRLQGRLDHARKYGFSHEELLSWLNGTHPDGKPELKKVSLNFAAIAAANMAAFRERVRFWGG